MDDADLLERIRALRRYTEEIGMAAMMAQPTKVCGRLVWGLLDGLNNLEALLSVKQ